MRPKRDITGNYMRLRTEFIKEYLAEGCDIRTAILFADDDLCYVEHLGEEALSLFFEIPKQEAAA